LGRETRHARHEAFLIVAVDSGTAWEGFLMPFEVLTVFGFDRGGTTSAANSVGTLLQLSSPRFCLILYGSFAILTASRIDGLSKMNVRIGYCKGLERL